MIARMKKYVFLTYHKDYDAFLNTLRSVGVVHIQEKKSVSENADLWELSSIRKRITAVLDYSRKLNEDSGFPPAQSVTKEECLHTIEKIEELVEEKNRLTAEKQALNKDIDYMQLWGDFDFENVEKLQKAGYVVSFFTCPTARFNPKWEEDYNAILISNFQSVSYFITITKTDNVVDIEAEQAKMPEAGLKKLYSTLKEVEKNIESVDNSLKEKIFASHNALEAFDKEVQNEFNFITVQSQADSQAGDKLMLLEGWTTAEQAPKMEAELDKKGYYYQPEEIKSDDKVPIQLKNNSYVRLFEPITKMFSLPNYAELDPTPLLAPFFMLFFGLCFGDAGYGLLVLLGATIMKGRVKPDMRPICTLAQWLGGTAVIVGLFITGTLFGIELVKIPALAPVKDYFLSQDALMQLAISLGMFHIVFGKAVAAYKVTKQKGFKFSLSHWAWVVVLTILLGMYAPAILSIFGAPLNVPPIPSMMRNILFGTVGVCSLAILFYNSPEKNIFFNFGISWWNIYNAIVGLLGDTLSYVRLFAIGLAGGILGGVFNMLAFEMSADFPLIARIPFVLIILLIGHSINIALSIISSLVHPIRLIFVEYFKNSEYEGGGVAYSPFKKI
jgi:V/A-type H+-transporting ATPase subunit I